MVGKTVDAIDSVGLEAYIARRRRVRDAARLGRRGAQGAGCRGAELRARGAPRDRRHVRPLRRHAQPGVRRDRQRDAGVRRRGRRDGAPDRTYRGKVATTFFYSSSGGRTAAIQDVWDSPPVPYLVSGAGPLRHDLAVPRLGAGHLHRGHRREEAEAHGPDARPRRSQSTRRIAPARLGRDAGGRRAVDRRFRPALRSSACARAGSPSVRSRSSGRPQTLAYGSAETLTGLARGVTAPRLESKVGAGAWQQVQALAPAADGAFSVQLQPGVTTFYRIASGTASGATLRVPVALGRDADDRRLRPCGDGLAASDGRLPRDAPAALRDGVDGRGVGDGRGGRQLRVRNCRGRGPTACAP